MSRKSLWILASITFIVVLIVLADGMDCELHFEPCEEIEPASPFPAYGLN